MINMKKITSIVLLVVTALIVHAQNATIPEWAMTVKVVDESDQPVANATVKVAWHIAPPPGESIAFTNVSGLTDTNGIFSVLERSGSIEVMCSAEKSGYYSAGGGHEFAHFKENNPEKYHPKLTLLLQKIIKPIPMYAKSVNLVVPTFDKPVGFDLIVGDWIAPFGKGLNADILFAGHNESQSPGYFDYKLTVSFPNRGDGIQEFGTPTTESGAAGSALNSAHQAPADGYKSESVLPKVSQRVANRNYYFRVRTVLDDQGKIITTHYGKIYGDFMQFRYFLNPTPNDRDVEFDPKQNLLKGVKSFERVREP